MIVYNREGQELGNAINIASVTQEDAGKVIAVQNVTNGVVTSWKTEHSVVVKETQHYSEYNAKWIPGMLDANGRTTSHGAYRTTNFIYLNDRDQIYYHIGTYRDGVMAVFYDASKNVVSYVTATETHKTDYAEGLLTIPATAKYCRITMWLDVTDGTHSDQYIVHYVDTANKEADERKAEMPTGRIENFSVHVNCHDYTQNDADQFDAYEDYGVIKLPENYSVEGKQTKMIILCGGTGERIGVDTNPQNFHGWSYFTEKGYAVMDMNGMPSGWADKEGFPTANQHYCNKYLLESYKKGYDYVVGKYNIDKTVYVAGISMGGGASALIVQAGIIPVEAHCCFCPALSVYKQDYMKPWNAGQKQTIAGQWGFADWDTETTFDQAYFLQNIDKITGFDNLLINAIGDHDTANANYNNEAEATAYNAMSKVYPVPLKIWHCEDDSVVAFRYSQFMVQMIKNAGGKAWLRSFATGDHSGGWGYGSVSDTGLYGKPLTVSVPFYEAWLFFSRFGATDSDD